MPGVLVEDLQINPGVMDLIRLQVLHQQFLLLKNQKQERCACVNKQRILHSVMDLIWAWAIDPGPQTRLGTPVAAIRDALVP